MYKDTLNYKTLTATAAFFSYALLSQQIMAEEVELNTLEPETGAYDRTNTHITITGEYRRINDVPGSAYVVEGEKIEKFNRSDINRVLSEVPGVNIQEEDGYGLRPNIGFRGGRVDRSADITLMEDSVLIAPAPYAAPSAYYFPHVERMEGVEVRKGSSSIKYGPRTTNGALNLISSSIPQTTSGQVNAGIGSYGHIKGGFKGGTAWEHGGFVVDYNHNETDGFKDIDIVGGDTGFRIDDYMGKLRLNTARDADIYQEVELKVGYTDEISNETYLGLTDADFRADPFRRYAASQVDQIDSEHSQVQARYMIAPRDDMTISATLYNNEFQRNWYKLQSVTAGGSKKGLSGVLSDPASSPDHLAILRGDTDGAADSLTVRGNNREYYARGIQSAITWDTEIEGIANALEFGARYHVDEEDRLQYEDGYSITSGVMALTSSGVPGSQTNRVTSADAYSLYVQDQIDLGKLTLVPGLRYEYVELTRENFSKSDPTRSAGPSSTFTGSVDAFVPGLGGTFDLTDEWTLLAGMHKGFSPPGAPSSTTEADNMREEESINYEAGVRYNKGFLRGEVIGFFTDYDNLLGRDTFSSGGSGSTGTFNGGEVEVHGIEALFGYDFSALTNQTEYRFPFQVTYSYTDAEFKNSFDSDFSEWGSVTAGDKLPYIPEHQIHVSLGVETDAWLVNATAKWVDEMRTIAGSGAIPSDEGTDSSFVVDVTGEVEVLPDTRAFVTVNNLFNDEYIVARRPAGARPGMPLTVLAGAKWEF